MRSLFAVFVFAVLTPLGTVVYPQEWTASAYAGAVTVLTRGEKREFVASRLELVGPTHALANLSGFLRGDLTGSQDGGDLDLGDVGSFRTIEVAGGLRYSARGGPWRVAALGGWTYSVEGDEGAPLDSRLFTVAGLIGRRVGEDGYVYIGAGHHGPVGGAATLLSASIPSGVVGTRLVLDVAFPMQTVSDRRTWTVKAGAVVLAKRFGLGL